MGQNIYSFGQQVEIGGDVSDDGLADVFIASSGAPARLHVVEGVSRAPY